jgi:hypothetical protein
VGKADELKPVNGECETNKGGRLGRALASFFVNDRMKVAAYRIFQPVESGMLAKGESAETKL